MKFVMLDNMPGRVRLPKVHFPSTPSSRGYLKAQGIGKIKLPRIPIPVKSSPQSSLKKLMTLPESKTEPDLSKQWSQVLQKKSVLEEKQHEADKKAFIKAATKSHTRKKISKPKKVTFETHKNNTRVQFNLSDSKPSHK